MGASTHTSQSEQNGSGDPDRPDSGQSRRRRPTLTWLVVLLVMLSLLGAIWYTAVLAWNIKGRQYDEVRLDLDITRLRELIGLLDVRRGGVGRLPLAADGHIDVFGPVRETPTGEAVHLLDILKSERFETGPTLAEVRAGNYSGFAYLRYRGKPPDDKLVPLLWDPAPDRKNQRLVVYSDGAIRLVNDGVLADQLIQNHQG